MDDTASASGAQHPLLPIEQRPNLRLLCNNPFYGSDNRLGALLDVLGIKMITLVECLNSEWFRRVLKAFFQVAVEPGRLIRIPGPQDDEVGPRMA